MHAKWIPMLTFVLFSVCSVQAGNQKVLYTFTGAADGGTPAAGVIFDSAGNLYGVTQSGGIYGHGVVFQLTPSTSGAWNETVLYSFTGTTDGEEPQGGLVIDSAGNLYGTASFGGDPIAGCGTVFKLAPSTSGWTFTVLHTFLNGKDGCSPQADLQLVSDNFLLGTTAGGGAGAEGTAFGLSSSGTGYVNSAFLGTEGKYPGGLGVFLQPAFAVYGTTYLGGTPGLGNIFELAWGTSFSWGNHIELKHTFNKTSAGYFPMGNLATQYANGIRSMFGATSSGGAGGDGTIYRLTESQTQFDAWSLAVLHEFSGADGDSPWAGVVLDASGNLYGTTQWGGTDPSYAGTVFRLAPGPKNTWVHSLLYTFTGAADGAVPASGLLIDTVGNLYGTTHQGGAYHQGIVYEVPYSAAFPKPTSLTFGIQPIGTTSAAQRIALLNPTGIAIVVTNISVQGDFAISQNRCQNGIQPKTHCDVYITFTPTGTSRKPRAGSVTFTDTTFNTPQTVALSGTVPAATKTTLVASPSVSFAQQDVIFTATVAASQGTVPDGDVVVFFDGDEPLDQVALTSGTAIFDTPWLEPGHHRITAQYTGDPAFDFSSASIVEEVDKNPTVTALTSTPDPSQHGNLVTFVATVTSPTLNPPGGEVRFWDGNRSIATVSLFGSTATFTTSNLAAGPHAITAQFTGLDWWAPSTSPVVIQTVQ